LVLVLLFGVGFPDGVGVDADVDVDLLFTNY